MISEIVDFLFRLWADVDPGVQVAVLVIVVSFLAAAIVWKLWNGRQLRHTREDLERALQLMSELQDDLDRRGQKLEEAESSRAELLTRVSDLKREIAALRVGQEEDERRLQEKQSELSRVCRDLGAAIERLDAIGRLDTGVWTATRQDNGEVPAFRPVASRRAKIISFVNFKGGVGKTALTGNLGSALAAGVLDETWRCLLVDLDYQGTLSNMCVARQDLQYRRENSFTSDRLLDSTDEDPATLVQRLGAPVRRVGGADVIVAHESLEDADFQLQAKFAVVGEEVRFRHRAIFHERDVAGGYDLIVFDCPPRFTTSPVNALLASDSIFIPTGPHPNDIDAVRRTLRWIQKLRDLVEFKARVGGVILNRTYRGGTTADLTKQELQQYDTLVAMMKGFDESADKVFRNTIRYTNQVASYGELPYGVTKHGLATYGDVARELREQIGGTRD